MSYSSRQFAKEWINHYSRKDTNHHIKGSDTAANRRTLVIVPFSVVIDDRLGGGRLDTFTTIADTEMDLNTATNWDVVTPTDYTVAATRAGKDFYIYACVQAGTTPKILLSANSTYPSGYTANNSRKIGGFHCIPGNCVGLGVTHPYYGYLAGDIHIHSIWDLLDKPKYASPEGMAKVTGVGWVDIYLASGDGTANTSVFGATIKDTIAWHAAVDIGLLRNKRLLDDQEFAMAAEGSPAGTAIAGAADPGTVTLPSDSNTVTIISNYGLVGCCGVMYQWLRDTTFAYLNDGAVSSSGKLGTVYHVASPGGNPIYVKFDADGAPYLCSNLATVAVSVWVVFGTYYAFKIHHDADAATGGLQVYIDYDASAIAKMIINNTAHGKNCFVVSTNPQYQLQLVHTANAATTGVALSYDDGADGRLEATLPGSADTTFDVSSVVNPASSWYTLPGSKGDLFRQVYYGEAKLMAGGCYSDSTHCGSRCRKMTLSSRTADATNSARYMGE